MDDNNKITLSDRSESNIGINSDNLTTPIVEIETKNKKNSNFIFYVGIIILIILAFSVDKITKYIEDKEYSNINITNNDNLINGYIKINDKDNYMINNNIKFYNFKLSGNSLLFNYTSSKDINNIDKFNIYIEMYDSNLNLIDIVLFKCDDIENNIISTYSVKLDNYIYKNTYYVKIKNYENIINNSLDCVLDNDIIVYSFMFYRLNSYSVKTKSSDELINSLVKYDIEYTLEDDMINYNIDLNSVSALYDTSIKLNDNYFSVKNNMSDKGWTCK